jgi:hypothetical protein
MALLPISETLATRRVRSYEKYQLERPRVSIASLIQSPSPWKKKPPGAGALFFIRHDGSPGLPLLFTKHSIPLSPNESKTYRSRLGAKPTLS